MRCQGTQSRKPQPKVRVLEESSLCNVVRRRATNFENSVFQFADRMSGSSFIVKRFSGFGVRLMILGVTTIAPLETPNPGDTR